MLFNSFPFILLFLPIACAISFAITRRYGNRAGVYWVLACSLFFYCWWNPRYLALLIPSIVFNYWMGIVINRSVGSRRKMAMVAGVTLNIILLGYYKYSNFFVDMLNLAGLINLQISTIILPLGISFFTLQQIAFLVDTYRGDPNEKKLSYYALFVCFFPHLIAGPIVHHKKILPQFRKPGSFSLDIERFAQGLTWFAIGLFKKVIIADQCSLYATPIFNVLSKGTRLDYPDAWLGALAYSFQLYFDFSAYSDMAIGLAMLFGINLPVNFQSPYQSGSIIEFWRRWHITLSQYLRDYIYIPLGGNRLGSTRRFINVMLTMLIGGIWHGAGWTFFLWGWMHGMYLVINHLWIMFLEKAGFGELRNMMVYRGISWFVTFVAVVFAWVMFRANTFHDALYMWRGMLGFENSEFHMFSLSEYVLAFTCILVIAAIAFFLPSASDLMNNQKKLRWQPSFVCACFTGVILAVAILSINKPSEFLYFRF